MHDKSTLLLFELLLRQNMEGSSQILSYPPASFKSPSVIGIKSDVFVFFKRLPSVGAKEYVVKTLGCTVASTLGESDRISRATVPPKLDPLFWTKLPET